MNSHGRLSEFGWVMMEIRKDDEIGVGWKISRGGSKLMEWGNKIQGLAVVRVGGIAGFGGDGRRNLGK